MPPARGGTEAPDEASTPSGKTKSKADKKKKRKSSKKRRKRSRSSSTSSADKNSDEAEQKENGKSATPRAASEDDEQDEPYAFLPDKEDENKHEQLSPGKIPSPHVKRKFLMLDLRTQIRSCSRGLQAHTKPQ